MTTTSATNDDDDRRKVHVASLFIDPHVRPGWLAKLGEGAGCIAKKELLPQSETSFVREEWYLAVCTKVAHFHRK